jgi:hypothetical protein
MGKIELQQQFIELRAKGVSFTEISKTIAVSKPTLIKWSRQHNLEIKNQSALELEAFRLSLELDRRSRLTRLSAITKQLETAIANADLTKIPVSQAIALWLKCNELASNEDGPVVLEDAFDITNVSIAGERWNG